MRFPDRIRVNDIYCLPRATRLSLTARVENVDSRRSVDEHRRTLTAIFIRERCNKRMSLTPDIPVFHCTRRTFFSRPNGYPCHEIPPANCVYFFNSFLETRKRGSVPWTEILVSPFLRSGSKDRIRFSRLRERRGFSCCRVFRGLESMWPGNMYEERGILVTLLFFLLRYLRGAMLHEHRKKH